MEHFPGTEAEDYQGDLFLFGKYLMRLIKVLDLPVTKAWHETEQV